MRLKKFLALTMAATMVMSPVTALASELNTPGGTDTPIDITGETQYLDTVKYVVTLPTAGGLNFKLDPQGTFGYFAENDSETAVDAGTALDAFAGKIVGTGKQSVVNKSSVPIVVTCNFTLSTDAASVNVITDKDAAIDDKGNDVRLNIVGGTYASDTDKFTAGTYATAVGTTATTAIMALGAADYEFKKSAGGEITYEPKAAATGVTTEVAGYFSIAGDVSKEGDWTEVSTKPLKLSCVYSFVGASSITDATIVDNFVTENADQIVYLKNVKPAYGYFDTDTWVMWIGIINTETTGGITDSTKLSNVKIGDTGAASSEVVYTVDSSCDWISIAWDDMADAVTDGETYSYTVTFTYDGNDYSLTVDENTVNTATP